jgi:hypothetical protein
VQGGSDLIIGVALREHRGEGLAGRNWFANPRQISEAGRLAGTVELVREAVKHWWNRTGRWGIDDLFARIRTGATSRLDWNASLLASRGVERDETGVSRSLEDLDGGGVTRIDFDQPERTRSANEIDAEQAEQAEFNGKRAAERLQLNRFVSGNSKRCDRAGIEKRPAFQANIAAEELAGRSEQRGAAEGRDERRAGRLALDVFLKNAAAAKL